MDMYWRGRIKDERDTTMTSRMGLGIIRTLTDEIRKSYAYLDQIRSVQVLRKNQTVLFFRHILGILSDPWHVTMDRGMPLRISQGH